MWALIVPTNFYKNCEVFGGAKWSRIVNHMFLFNWMVGPLSRMTCFEIVGPCSSSSSSNSSSSIKVFFSSINIVETFVL